MHGLYSRAFWRATVNGESRISDAFVHIGGYNEVPTGVRWENSGMRNDWGVAVVWRTERFF